MFLKVSIGKFIINPSFD